MQIGRHIRDQLREQGHSWRPRDLDRIAALGIRRLRMPVLWGAIAASGRPDFRWPDRRFARARALGIDPIAGLLHHGWGPGGLTPLDPRFAPAFAAYAGAVARRYPWLRDYTPVNEPVTTARFAGLYGLWHPHGRDEATFLRLTFGAIEATAAAMAAIRLHRPDARLIQTEDVGRSFASPDLAQQADHENIRRFLGFDLLCGRVKADHPFHSRLLNAGISAQRLQALVERPCPPDILGLDHYLTSDRWLDSDLTAHPHVRAGGNGRQVYVDVAAVHQPALHPRLGVLHRLRELHARYHLPIAVTENHNGCTREEQLRWLIEAWNAARQARSEDIDVRAVTSWALFGAYDWNSLLCDRTGFYESGAFDLRHRPPRLTAVGRALAGLAQRGAWDHPVLEGQGWWQDAPMPEAPLLAVMAPDGWWAALQEASQMRRLPICRTTPNDRDGPTDGRLGRLWIDGAGRTDSPTIRFVWRQGGRDRLDVRAEAVTGTARDTALHAVLDLILDQTEGAFRLSKLQEGGQYRILRLSLPARGAVDPSPPADRPRQSAPVAQTPSVVQPRVGEVGFFPRTHT
ncbi:MAG: dTDP-4-dehydrorhamnose reductase [Rhodobacteraceae bacterium PARR1]|nr:MAG: dTDP-4-dehydrorhamnose reductase [Rhodobacteraceae bacterium PARR1]